MENETWVRVQVIIFWNGVKNAMADSKSSRSSRVGLPLKVGIAFALVAMVLALVGIVRGIVPPNPLSVFLALLISGASWGLVAWAVTTAVVDVERDVEDRTTDGSEPAADTGRDKNGE
jgi:hypothetical protein